MPSFDIESFWKRRLSGAIAPSQSKLGGWLAAPDDVPGFIEPELILKEGNPETARIIIVSAPGAVGKSTFAKRIGRIAGFAIVDLSQTSPLGGNFFKGGLANAFGMDALSSAAAGRLGLLVDALDEAQLRAPPDAYAAALLDMAGIAASQSALPVAIFGRTLAAEEAWLLLSSAEQDVCLLEISFFDEERAKRYIESKLPILAARSSAVNAAFEKHGQAFKSFALQTRRQLTSLGTGSELRFAGYAPVLDAICAFTLEEDALNPQARLATLKARTQVELIRSVSQAILQREQIKLHTQLLEAYPDAKFQIEELYSPDEQLARVAGRIFGVAAPPFPVIENPDAAKAYAEMVEQFGPQHPFLDGKGASPANLVFAAYLLVWALQKDEMAAAARTLLRSKSDIVSGVIFDLFAGWLDEDKDNRTLSLADVGPLYESLKSQIGMGKRASLEVSTEDDEMKLFISFEIVDRGDPLIETRVYGPYRSFPDAVLELQTPVTNVSIQAPIFVSLGDGVAQQIGAPSDISVDSLTIAARQLQVYPSTPENLNQLVFLAATDIDCQSVQTVTVRDAELAVSWPGADQYPWRKYSVEPPPPAPSPDIAFMRRRLRRILTAFRSHSKGELVRLAAKIDHLRMTKGSRGARLVEQLVTDKILSTFDAGKFYVLNPDRLGDLLKIDYQSLQQQRFTEGTDKYLERIIKGGR